MTRELVFKNVDEMIDWIMEREYLMELLADRIDVAFYGEDDD
jgi:hypothetical protein